MPPNTVIDDAAIKSIDTLLPVTLGFGGVGVGMAHVTTNEQGALIANVTIAPHHARMVQEMLAGYIPTSMSFSAIPDQIRPTSTDDRPQGKFPCHRCGPGYNIGDEGCQHTLKED